MVEADNDVPELVARAVHESSESETPWDELSDENKGKKIRRAKKRLSTEAAERMSPDMLDARDPNGDIRDWLRRIGERLNRR